MQLVKRAKFNNFTLQFIMVIFQFCLFYIITENKFKRVEQMPLLIFNLV